MDLTEEVSGAGGYQSRTQSLRDKMKKRRQAIESLMTGEAGGTERLSKEETPLKKYKRLNCEGLRGSCFLFDL